MKAIEFVKILKVKNSDLDYLKVINEFKLSVKAGKNYCERRGWSVELTETKLTVYSKAVFGFYFSALVRVVNV